VSEVREHECIIIGGGAAGLTAAMYAVRYGLDSILLTEGAPGGQTATATTIENFPGFPDGVNGAEFMARLTQQAENTGVVFENARVNSIERAGGRWDLLSDDAPYSSVAVILCVGASPRRLKIPGERDLYGHGVSYCATCDGFFFRGQTVAVIGGGNTALEEAMYLADIAEKVYVIHRRDELRAEKLIADRGLANPKLEFIWDTIPTQINGKDLIESVSLHNKKTGEDSTLKLDGLFVAIGYEPNTDFLADLIELQDGFILTDQRMATNQPGIFAAGDVRVTPLRQITTAVGDAAIAADSAYRYVSERR
jgi:thioredoxin reductase (NADPH)